MNFRIIELFEADKFQYLRIHKNGNTSIKKCLEKYCKDYFQTDRLSKTKPRWTVIRDPYKRFLSGLSYDLERHSVDVKDVKLKDLFTANETHPRNLMFKNINHSFSQLPYLLNTQVEHYIDIDDLNLFLKMHFSESFCENKSNLDTTHIEKHFDKDEIMKYLHMDYYVYNYIKKSPFLWEWQHGKIF